MTGSLAWDIYLDQKGCCDITDACDDRKVYEELSETLETSLTKSIQFTQTVGHLHIIRIESFAFLSTTIQYLNHIYPSLL